MFSIASSFVQKGVINMLSSFYSKTTAKYICVVLCIYAFKYTGIETLLDAVSN